MAAVTSYQKCSCLKQYLIHSSPVTVLWVISMTRVSLGRIRMPAGLCSFWEEALRKNRLPCLFQLLRHPHPHSLVCDSLFPPSEPARTGQVLTLHRSDLASIVISPSLTPTLLPPFKGSLRRHWAHLDNLPISRSAN